MNLGIVQASLNKYKVHELNHDTGQLTNVVVHSHKPHILIKPHTWPSVQRKLS